MLDTFPHRAEEAPSAPRARLLSRVGRPPIPQEHGAWVMLYAPLLMGLWATGAAMTIPALLLFLAVTGAYLARNATGLLIRKRGKAGTRLWLEIYLGVFLLGLIPLLTVYRRTALLEIGLIVAGLFCFHALLLILPARKRLDRTLWGEILALGALTLTAPAAWAVARGALEREAWLLWIGSTLFFSSGIFYVKTLLEAVKVRGAFGAAERWRVGRANMLYHLLLLAAILCAARPIGFPSATPLLIAFAPILLRAFLGGARLTNRLPPLKRVGLIETLYALWFVGFFLAALQGVRG